MSKLTIFIRCVRRAKKRDIPLCALITGIYRNDNLPVVFFLSWPLFLFWLAVVFDTLIIFRNEKWDVLVPLEKHLWRSVTLLKVTLHYGCFSCLLNCTNGTKSRKAPQMHLIAHSDRNNKNFWRTFWIFSYIFCCFAWIKEHTG